MEYRIVRDMDLNDLVTKVDEAIAKGWKPQGGVAISQHYGFKGDEDDREAYVVGLYVQAMTKE